MSASVIVGILVGALVVFRVIGRQVTGSLVSRRSLLVMPGILLTLGLLSTATVFGAASAGEIAFLVLDCVVLLGFGVARGASIRLTTHAEGLWQKGTNATLVLWLLTIAFRIGTAFAASLLWPHGALNQAALALTVGITIGAQNVMIYRRALVQQIPLAAQQA